MCVLFCSCISSCVANRTSTRARESAASPRMRRPSWLWWELEAWGRWSVLSSAVSANTSSVTPPYRALSCPWPPTPSRDYPYIDPAVLCHMLSTTDSLTVGLTELTCPGRVWIAGKGKLRVELNPPPSCFLNPITHCQIMYWGSAM